MSQSMEKVLTSPYNFVTLNDTVYFPDWAHQVSHDVPFRDGLSGSFELSIEAKTPIFTRDDLVKENFLNRYGQPFLKGSSLRGMLRQVLKIASFGKMDAAEEQYFGIRDLSRNSEYLQLIRPNNIRAGWLLPDSNVIEPCEFALVAHKDLISCQRETGNSRWTSNLEFPERYDKWTGPLEMPARIAEGKANTKRALIMSGGTQHGTLVFTGPIANKKNEFFFYSGAGKKENLEISDLLFRKFEQVHSSSQQQTKVGAPGLEPNASWKYWKEQRKKGQRVPVFYVEERPGSLRAFGLPRMFRMPSTASVHSSIANVSRDHLDLNQFDLVDLMFGYAPTEIEYSKSKRDTSLKGRISITHADQVAGGQKLPKVTAVLNSPKPSFYPAYLQQNGKDNKSDWLHDNARAHGWKRYPARETVMENPTKADSDSVNTTFIPLAAGTVFKSTVYFHNLRPVELGALLWTLDFGGHIDGLVHRFGMAKPYGFGEVALKANKLEARPNDRAQDVPDMKELKRVFERHMEDQTGTPNGWLGSPQLVELLSMANPKSGDQKQLRYPPGPNQKPDNFKNARNNQLFLPEPGGALETLALLKENAKRLKIEAAAEHARQEQKRLANLSPKERMEEELVDLSEQGATDWVRTKIHQKEEPDAERRALLQEIFHDKYYDAWSQGKQAGLIPVAAGAKKLQEYASWLLPPESMGQAGPQKGPNTPKQPDDSPFSQLSLPEHEQESLENCHATKGDFRVAMDQCKMDDNWSADGLQEMQKLLANYYPAGKKTKKKDEPWRDAMAQYIQARITKLSQ